MATRWRLVGKHSAPPRLFPCLLLTSFLHLCFLLFRILLIEKLLYTVKQIMYVSIPHLHFYFPYIRSLLSFLHLCFFACLRLFLFKIHLFDNTISDLCLQQFGASTGYSCLILESSVLQHVYSFQEILETLDEYIIW